jgi:uncharacterized protein YeaO (DUF488 family)
MNNPDSHAGFKDLCKKHTHDPPRWSEFWGNYKEKINTNTINSSVCCQEYKSWPDLNGSEICM